MWQETRQRMLIVTKQQNDGIRDYIAAVSSFSAMTAQLYQIN